MTVYNIFICIYLEDERLKSNVLLLNKESVELRKAHDNAMVELDQYKDENRRLTEQLLKLKESQMDQMDALNEEYEKLRKINAAKLAQQEQEIEQKLNEPFATKMQRRHTTVVAHQHQEMNNKNKSNPNSPGQAQRSRWSIAGIFGMNKDEKKDNNQYDKSNGKHSRSESVDFTAHRAPIVDLYGPSLFNITPPQLVKFVYVYLFVCLYI